jgi:uncharacterized repeat protein (TIGR03803 family)
MILMLAAAIAAPAQTVTTLASLNGTDGVAPFYVALVQGRDGNLWGAAQEGGNRGCYLGCGTIFKMSPSGHLSTIYSFTGTGVEGYSPWAGLVLGVDGNFYGDVTSGGAGGYGSVFKLTPAGVLSVLASFNSTHGSTEQALAQGTDGSLYGTTLGGGTFGYGTIFKLTLTGTSTTLHDFDSTDGAYPYDSLVQGTDANFYGTADAGGTNNGGTIFKITPAGHFTLLYSFGTEGDLPLAGLVQGSDGDFYGTTFHGGDFGYGTVFKITAAGAFTSLMNFDDSNGAYSEAPLVLGTDGNLYGTTSQGGTNGGGTIFQINKLGQFTTLYNFDVAGKGSASPYSGLVQGTNGKFYGVTRGGGTRGFGTVYSLDVGLGPFARLSPAFGVAGLRVGVLGYGLTGTTSVTFNGVPAAFTVASDTFLTATAPEGVTNGPVQVVTPSGTLTSNVNFQVLP